MKILKPVFCLALCLMLFVSVARAEDAVKALHGTKDEAVAMVKKAVDYVKANGADKAYAEFNKTDGKLFVDRDLYVVVYSMEGEVLAHGANAKLIGQNLLDTEDADGKPFVRERVQLAGTHDNFWQDYKFTDPVTKKIAPKQTYCERLKDTVICTGVYKD